MLANAADAASQQALYKRYHLTEDRGALSTTWKRADGEYNWVELSEVAKQFAESEDVYDRAGTRGVVIGSVSGAGGGVVGFTLGYNLTAEETKRMSAEQQIALYATGGAIIVTSVVMALLWSNPADEFAETYNRELRKKLGLDGGRTDDTPGSVSRRPAWVPVAVGLNGAQWSF